MSSESLDSDTISTKEDIESTEFDRRPDISSDSSSSADITTSCGLSTIQDETFEDETIDSAISILNSSDENHHALDIGQTSLWSGALTRKASSLEESSSKWVSTLNPLQGPSTRRASSLNNLKGPSSRRVSSLNSLERPSRKVSSLNSMEKPTARRVSSLDLLEKPTARRVSSLDPPAGSSTRRVSSLDPLEGPSTRRVSSLNPQEGPSTRRVSSPDPLEGPSTRTVWVSDSSEGSSTSVCNPYHSETATNQHFDSESPTEQNAQPSNRFRAFELLNGFLRRHSRQIRHSVYYPLLLAALIVIPYSAGYMGCNYLQLCGGCPKLSGFLYVEGLLGTGILFLQFIAILSKRYFSPHLTGEEFYNWKVLLGFPFLLILVIEFLETYTCEPVFVPTHKEFCAKVFYNYAYYVNFVAAFVIFLLMLINIPGYYDPSEEE